MTIAADDIDHMNDFRSLCPALAFFFSFAREIYSGPLRMETARCTLVESLIALLCGCHLIDRQY